MSADYTLPPVPPVPPSPHSPSVERKWTTRERHCIAAYGHACAEAARATLLARIAELEAANKTASPILRGVGKINGDGWKDVTKLGEVVFAWNDELPTPYAPGQYPRIELENWSASTGQYEFRAATVDEVRNLFQARTADRDRLRAEVEAMRAASVIEWEPGRSYTAAELLRRAIRGLRVRKDHYLWPAVRNMCGVGSTVAHYLCRWAGRDPDTGKDIAAIATQPSTPWVNPLAAEVENLRADAGRWREVRRGQTLSVVDWVGVHLRAESADAAVDAAIAARKGEGSDG